MGSRGRKPTRKNIARERIEILFYQAERFAKEDLSLSNQCVQRARQIAMKERIRPGPAYTRRYCRRCYGYFIPGLTSRTRINRGKVTITCLQCGFQRRYHVQKKGDKNEKK